jgi:hypothetical protein
MGLPLQVVVLHGHIPQIQAVFVRHITGISGIIIALAVHQDPVMVPLGGHQQAAGHTVIIAGAVLIGGEEWHIPQQISGKVLEVLGRQMDDPDHFHMDGLRGLFLHQLLGVAGLEEETAFDLRSGQTIISLPVSAQTP